MKYLQFANVTMKLKDKSDDILYFCHQTTNHRKRLRPAINLSFNASHFVCIKNPKCLSPLFHKTPMMSKNDYVPKHLTGLNINMPMYFYLASKTVHLLKNPHLNIQIQQLQQLLMF